MKSLTEMNPSLMEWRRKVGPTLAYELHTETGIAASLTFPDRDSTLALVETAEGSWTLMHLGLLNPVVTLREAGEKQNLATFRPHPFRHGRLDFTDGATFEWATLHGEAAGGAFLDASGSQLVRLQVQLGLDPEADPDLASGLVVTGKPPQARWRHAILSAIGWYVLVLDHLKEHPEHAAEFSLRM
jgi:hypothetical protein